MNLKRILSAGMTALMLCSMNPVAVFAQEELPIAEEEIQIVNETENNDETQDVSEDTNDSSETLPEETGPAEEETEQSVNQPPVTVEENKEQPAATQNNKPVEQPKKEDIQQNSYSTSTWYHPVDLVDLGYVGETKDAIKLDNFVTHNYENFLLPNNPFQTGQCTWFAWSRFYQVYGFDSGARGNGKTNAAEIVKAHPDLFKLSSTPSAGSVFSMEKNTLIPKCGHVGFVEAFDGDYLWISEGNVSFSDTDTGNIWIHKVKWTDFKKQYPDVVFAVPDKDEMDESDVIYQKLMEVSSQTIQTWIKVLEGNK